MTDDEVAAKRLELAKEWRKLCTDPPANFSLGTWVVDLARALNDACSLIENLIENPRYEAMLPSQKRKPNA